MFDAVALPCMLLSCSSAAAAPSAAFCCGCEATTYGNSSELQLDYGSEAPQCSNKAGCAQQYATPEADYCTGKELCSLKAEFRPKRSPHWHYCNRRKNETEKRSSALIEFKRHCKYIAVCTVIFAYFVAIVGARPTAISLAADVSEALGVPKSPERGIQEINPILRHRYSSKIQERLKTLHYALSTIKSRNRQLQLARTYFSGRGIPLEYDGSMDDKLIVSVKNGSHRNTRNCFFSPLQCQLPYARRIASLDENNKENDGNNNNNDLMADTVITDGSDTVQMYIYNMYSSN